MAINVSELALQAKALTRFVPALVNSGIVSPHGGPRAMINLLPVLARYRFTTARELEQGYLTCPERLALIDDDGTLTYRQLRNQTRTFARYLQSLDLPEIKLGIMARNGRGIIEPLGAKGYTGGSVYMLNIGSSPEQLAGCIKETGINVLVIDDEFLPRLNDEFYDSLHVVVGHYSGAPPEELPRLEDIVKHPEAVDNVKLPTFPKHGYIVLMSSGTTGIPKGILRPEPTLPVVVASIVGAMPWRADQHIQLTASIFHTWGWACLNIGLAARNTIVTHRVFDAEQVLDDIERYSLDGLISSPIFFKRMVEADPDGKYDTSSLQFIASAGHALTPQIVAETNERFGPILCNVYGSTELALATTATMEQVAKDPTIGGKIASGTKLEILDEDGNPVPRGEVGEIYMTNSTALVGYTKPGKEVHRVRGLISIGDLGYIDEDNCLHVVGRADDMIIVGGENVHPQSVIEVLEAMPGILEVHAGGVEDDETFQRIAVWAVPTDDSDGKALSADGIRDWVKRYLADHSIPRDVHFLDKLPRNPTGKVVPRLLKHND
ncbi:AMP-binding protein [Corynebacterium camporealensis]|uniref:Acyl-CoA synthetase (AMP-forming)/AMP-acid ligase II n=1 Tax=Corynebacterium camporealensis TaxID=161896 RepID=A0A0F6QV75_9CORY|nr:AMP-binding protein [Corynebacterium camporealensis]AKE38205.1 acyl-CoA synthetase (AMP-forming)/AMP-acid ligase II [Corynebacterium camporealensis]